MTTYAVYDLATGFVSQTGHTEAGNEHMQYDPATQGIVYLGDEQMPDPNLIVVKNGRVIPKTVS
jgi:hypothetical protein